VQTFQYRGSRRASLPGNIIVLHPDELNDGAAGTESGLSYRMIYVAPEKIADALGRRGALPFVADPSSTIRVSVAASPKRSSSWTKSPRSSPSPRSWR